MKPVLVLPSSITFYLAAKFDLPPHSTVKDVQERESLRGQKSSCLSCKIKKHSDKHFRNSTGAWTFHDAWLTPIRVHVSSLSVCEGYFFFCSPPSIIPHFLTVLLLFQHGEVACSRHTWKQTIQCLPMLSQEGSMEGNTSLSVGLSLWSRPIYFNACTMDCNVFYTVIHVASIMNCHHVGDLRTVPL